MDIVKESTITSQVGVNTEQSLFGSVFPLSITSSEVWAEDPGGVGDTSARNCSCSCLGAWVALCWPLRPPRAERDPESKERTRRWCGACLLQVHWTHASLSSYIWSACFETIFSPSVNRIETKRTLKHILNGATLEGTFLFLQSSYQDISCLFSNTIFSL